MLWRLFVAGHATGHPSPGGVACTLLYGTVVTRFYTHELQRTTPNQACLIALRDGLQLVNENLSLEIISHRDLLRRIFEGEMQLRRSDHRHLYQEIMTEAQWKHLKLQFTTSAPSTMEHLDATIQAAEDAAYRAWKITNAPRCPLCQARMEVRQNRYQEFWGCSRYPNCKGRLQIYEETL